MSSALGIILSGGLRQPLLRRQMGVPIGALPVTEHSTLLGTWVRRMLEFSTIESILVVTSDIADNEMLSQAISSESLDKYVEVIVEPAGHRGPAGVLRDVGLDLNTDKIVVGELSSVPPPSVDEIVTGLGSESVGMTIGVSENQRPIGLYGFTRESLEIIPELGFFDVKEQLIPSLIEKGSVVCPIVMMPKQLRVGELHEWLQAIRFLEAGSHSEATIPSSARIEGASLIQQGAIIHETVSILDSIVMSGAEIESGAVIARSVIGPGVRVRKGFRIIDGILAGQTSQKLDDHGIAPSAQGSGRLGNRHVVAKVRSGQS